MMDEVHREDFYDNLNYPDNNIPNECESSYASRSLKLQKIAQALTNSQEELRRRIGTNNYHYSSNSNTLPRYVFSF